MRNTLPLFILASFFAITMLHAETPAWRHPAAPVRLRVELPIRPHSQLLVPVPQEWSTTYQDALAFTDQGVALPASAIKAGDVLLAVAINAHGHFTVKPPPAPGQLELPPTQPGISIYLTTTAAKENKAYDGTRVVTVERQIRSLTTRAFTAPEMLRLFSTSGRRRSRPMTGLTENISLLPQRDNWRHFPEGRQAAAMIHWETNWLLTEAKTVAFGADQTHVAWCILVNGQIAAAWQEGEPRPGGGAFGAALELPAGIHTIQMLVVQKPDEPIPACVIRSAGGPPTGVALTGLLPTRRPEWLGAEIQGQPENSLHTVIVPDATYCFPATDASINAYSVMADTDGIKRSYFDASGQELTSANGTLLLSPGNQIPAAKLSNASLELNFPGCARWQSGTSHNGRLRVTDLPAVLPNAAPLPLQVSCDWQDMLPELVQQSMTLKITQTDSANLELATVWTTMPNGDSFPPPELQLAPTCQQITIAAGLPRLITLPTLTINVLKPSDSLAGLIARGDGIFQHGQRALLVCEPLPESPRAATTAKLATSTVAHVALLDDFMALATAPSADLLPETLIAADLQSKTSSPQVTRVMSANAPGATPRLSLWQALPAAQHLRPDLAVLAVGALPLADGLSPLEWSAHLLFAAQSCLASGINPVLVALPGLPGIDHSISRLAALHTKEIGLALGVPVVDLHSERKIDHSKSQEIWFQAGATAPAMTMNATRQWLAQATAQALRRYLEQ